MPLTLTNSFSGERQLFVPRDAKRLTMYVCGPTVYNYAHIGNARPAVVFDVLARLLRARFGNLVYARNITDVDDKINAAAAAAGVSIGDVSRRFTQAYHADMAALGVRSPDVEPRVTDHIPEIVALIEHLLSVGHAYAAEGHVLFHIPSFPQYGALSGRNIDEMIAGARIEIAPFKKHPADFVLWKPSAPDQPGWDSPWGRGRPGWHIECSAMVLKHLGAEIDIHGGGIDLIFPHHENEIAQGTKATYWVHNGFITVDGRKMSKSLGNVLLVRDLLAEAPGEAIRLTLLSAHYRQPLDWTGTALQQNRRRLDQMYKALGKLREIEASAAPGPYLDGVNAALDDDLNTPAVLAELSRLGRMVECETSPTILGQLKTTLMQAGALLGILQHDPIEWFEPVKVAGLDKGLISERIRQRNAARANKDYAEADRIRDELASLGVMLEDTAGTTQWRSVP